MLRLRCGDIEQNPGPDLDSSTSSESSALPLNSPDLLNNFSVVHYNVQSIVNKRDVLETELRNFNIICITETWLHAGITDDEIAMSDFKLYRRDRTGDAHGGVCVYVDQNYHSKRRADLEMNNIECIWLEITIQHRKLLIGTFYRPPNSTNEILTSIENSIGLAYDTNIHNVLVTGDFNFDMLKDNPSSKVLNICQYFGLENLIKEPTHFTEHSSSLIDLFLTSDKNNVLLSGVGEPVLDQNIRFHCPIYCVFKINRKSSATFNRHVWLYDRGDYESFARDISNTDWDNLRDGNVDVYAKNVTNTIIDLATRHIPNKQVKIRQSDPPWLTNVIRKLMRKRKRYYDKFKQTKLSVDFNKYKQVRNLVISEVRKSKRLQTDKLADNLKNQSYGQNSWWKTLKNFIKPSQNASIPPLQLNDQVFSDDQDKADILNHFFTAQTVLDDRGATLPTAAARGNFSLDHVSEIAYL